MRNNSADRHYGQVVHTDGTLPVQALDSLTALAGQNERTSTADRKFFERMPWRQWRIRPASKAETETTGVIRGADGDNAPVNGRLFMLVTNLRPGARLRRGFYCDPDVVDIDADDRECHRIGEMLTGGAYLGVRR